MKVAMVGIRGVPAQYGGLETCAQEVGVRLVKRGHDVLVYCRAGTYRDDAEYYEGVQRRVLPRMSTKWTDTFTHTAVAMLDICKQKPDVVLAFNPGIGGLCLIPRLRGIPVALNPDGFDWRRRKWEWWARAFIYVSAWLGTRFTNQMIIDAVFVRKYYNEVFRCHPRAIYIPNGAHLETAQESPIPEARQKEILDRYGVEKDRYILFLSRHVPENSCELILGAFEKVHTDKKLLFGGYGAKPGDPYAEALKGTSDKRILFPGSIYEEEEVKALHHNCSFLVHGNQPGGTSLGLVKALGYGTCIMTLNTPDNVYAVQEAGVIYDHDTEDLRMKMQYLVDHPEEVEKYRGQAIERVKTEYPWEKIADQYEQALLELAGQAQNGFLEKRRAL